MGIDSGATYCDMRIGRTLVTTLELKDGDLKKASSGEEEGAGIRVLFDGVWGFYSTNDTSNHSLKNALTKAVEMARSGSRRAGRTRSTGTRR